MSTQKMVLLSLLKYILHFYYVLCTIQLLQRWFHFPYFLNRNKSENCQLSSLDLLTGIYQTIYEAHSGEDRIAYQFSAEAHEKYKEFSKEVVDRMNKLWDEDELSTLNFSKDKRTFVR